MLRKKAFIDRCVVWCCVDVFFVRLVVDESYKFKWLLIICKRTKLKVQWVVFFLFVSFRTTTGLWFVFVCVLCSRY